MAISIRPSGGAAAKKSLATVRRDSTQLRIWEMSATSVFRLVLPVPVKIAGAPVESALLASRSVSRLRSASLIFTPEAENSLSPKCTSRMATRIYDAGIMFQMEAGEYDEARYCMLVTKSLDV
jgi:hypothetical protein